MKINENPYSRLFGFFIAFALGVICIVVFRDNHVQGAAALVVVISAYAVIGSMLFGSSERDAHGDSVYYLGFCLTLVGLSVGLLLKDEGQETKQLINTFGFGLVATVTGLVARILIQNFSASTEVDVIDAAEKLKDSYVEFASSVTSTSVRMDALMKDFTTHVGQVVDELSSGMRLSMSEFTQASARASHALRNDLDDQAQLSLQKIEESAGKSLSAIMVAGHKAVESISGTAAQITERVAEAGRGVAEAGNAMKTSADSFKKGAAQVEKAAGSLDKAAVGVEQTTNQLSQDMQALQQSVGQLRDCMSDAVGPLREMVEFQKVIAQMKDASTDIHAELQGILSVVQSVAASAARVQSDAEQAADEVRRIARTASEVVAS